MNKAILMGRLTRDPELRTTQSGISIVSFTLAVDRRFKNQSGERESDFVSCKAWRQTAEFITKYFHKGEKLAIVGSIQTGSYEKDGHTVYTTDVVADEAYFVESNGTRQNGGQNQAESYQMGTYTQNSSKPAESRQDSNPFTPNNFAPTNYDDTSLPFEL